MPTRFVNCIQRFSWVTASLILLGGCDFEPKQADLVWDEPIQLTSGETVRIRRHVVLRQDRSLSGVTASAPVIKTSSIEILDSPGETAVWDAPVVPVVLDKDPATGEWIIIASTDNCLIWWRNGMPIPPYWAFRLRGKEWFLDALPESFLDRRANLFTGFSVLDDSRKLNAGLNKDKQIMIAARPGAVHYKGVIRSFSDMKCGPADTSSVESDFAKFRRAP